MKTLGITTAAILMVVVSFTVGGLLTYYGWNWFGLHLFPEYGAITFKTAVIFNCAKALIFYDPKQTDEKKSTIETIKDKAGLIFAALFVLFVFWIIKLILL